MEINEKQSIQLDEILKHLVKTGKPTSLKDINQELFPKETYDSCLSLFYILKEYYPRLLYPKSEVTDDLFWVTDYVPAFLSEGGFNQKFKTEFEKAKKLEEKENLDLEKLRYDVKNSRRIYKTYWLTFAFALIALVVSLFNLIKGFFN
jgi:hypothetical protein